MILVAGGTGFIGRHIVAALVADGHEVAILTRDPAQLTSDPQLADVTGRRGDVTDLASLQDAFEGIETVVMAAQFKGHPVEQPRKGLTYDAVDRIGTENLIAAAKPAGVERIIYISGAGVGRGRDEEWFVAKGKAEEAIRACGLGHLILRPSWAYGAEDKALNRIARIARFSPLVPVLGWNAQHVMPVAADDIGAAVAAAMAREGVWNSTFEIGGPDVLTMKEVVETLLRVLGRRRLLVPAPTPLMKLATLPLKVLPNPPLSPRAVDFATGDAIVDNAPMSAALGIHPIALEEGLARYL